MSALGANPLFHGHGHTPLVNDFDVDQFAWQFLQSDYVEDIHANWPLERRLEGFLRNRGLARLADDGNVCTSILDRVMTYRTR